MFNLLDLMRAAQGGAAMENMARQFGLSVDQTRRALENLMPAFALGFRRNAADPMGFANLLRMMGSGQYAGFYDQPGLAYSPQAWSEGNRILGQLFGGNEVSRQVAEQTAAWSGVAPDVMKQMMPPVATMLMGGLFRSAANEGLADLFDRFAKALRGEGSAPESGTRRPGKQPPGMPDPFDAWSGMMGSMWGGAPAPAAKREPERAPAGEAFNPFAPWAAMMNSMLGGQRAEPEPPPEPPPPPAPQNPAEFFGRMFDIGREAQQQHLATLRTIFDSCWGTESKRS